MNQTLPEMVVAWKLKLRQVGWRIMWLGTFFRVMMAVVSSFQTYYFFSTMPSSPPAYRAVLPGQLIQFALGFSHSPCFPVGSTFPRRPQSRQNPSTHPSLL